MRDLHHVFRYTSTKQSDNKPDILRETHKLSSHLSNPEDGPSLDMSNHASTNSGVWRTGDDVGGVAETSYEYWLDKMAGTRQRWIITLHRYSCKIPSAWSSYDCPDRGDRQAPRPSGMRSDTCDKSRDSGVTTASPAKRRRNSANTVHATAGCCLACGSIVNVRTTGGVFSSEHREECLTCKMEREPQRNACDVDKDNARSLDSRRVATGGVRREHFEQWMRQVTLFLRAWSASDDHFVQTHEHHQARPSCARTDDVALNMCSG